jgi:hypothetical protein
MSNEQEISCRKNRAGAEAIPFSPPLVAPLLDKH